jgi:hypothetical protein
LIKGGNERLRSLFLIPTAGVSFFFCAWLAMIFWGIVAPKLDIITISYPMAMLITIAVHGHANHNSGMAYHFAVGCSHQQKAKVGKKTMTSPYNT